MQNDPTTQHIVKQYGSISNFYKHIADQTGTTPDQVMQEVEKMTQIAPNPNQQQQSIGQPDVQTPVSQIASGPVPASPMKVQAQSQQLQGQGMAPAQAQNQAAINPQNQVSMAKGGDTKAAPIPQRKPTIPPQTPEPQSDQPSQDEIDNTTRALLMDGTAKRALTPLKSQPVGRGSPKSPDNRQAIVDAQQPLYGGYAKGGEVHPKMGELKLKDILQLLASHPGVSGDTGQDTSAGSTGYAQGGVVNPNSAASEPGNYAKGGLLGMADGGNVSMEEEDQITGYGPDGAPIIQNKDGSTSSGDINQLLGRPENTSSLGTGADPTNATSKNAANTPLIGVAMSKGGADEAPPPGSLSHEIADDVPVNLSEGEFVFSADSTRFYGLQKLHAMQDFARDQLAQMEQTGGIRSPGDGKNPDQGFQSDTQPNSDFYDQGAPPQDADKDGMKKGGLMTMAAGGDVLLPYQQEEAQDEDDEDTSSDSEEDANVQMTSGGLLKRTDASARNMAQRDENDDNSGYVGDAQAFDRKSPRDEDKTQSSDEGLQADKNRVEKNPAPPAGTPPDEGGIPYSSGGSGVWGPQTKDKVKAAKGGLMKQASDPGRDRKISSSPQAGSFAVDYARGGPVKKHAPQYLDKGGIVSSRSTNLFPSRSKSVTAVPTDGIKLPKQVKGPKQRVNGPHVNVASYGSNKFKLGAKSGGLIRSIKQPFSTTE